MHLDVLNTIKDNIFTTCNTSEISTGSVKELGTNFKFKIRLLIIYKRNKLFLNQVIYLYCRRCLRFISNIFTSLVYLHRKRLTGL